MRDSPRLDGEIQVVPAFEVNRHDRTIANYTFLPWVRQGIASRITRRGHPWSRRAVERAAVRISLKVNDEARFRDERGALLGPAT